MNGSGRPDGFDLIVTKAHFCADSTSQICNPLLVAGRIGISRLDGGGYDPNGRADRFPETYEGFMKHVLHFYTVGNIFGDTQQEFSLSIRVQERHLFCVEDALSFMAGLEGLFFNILKYP
jgi:hypothetical protein